MSLRCSTARLRARCLLSGLTRLEDRRVPATLTFQEGVNDYFGTQDAALISGTPNTPTPNDIFISIDRQDGSDVLQGLLRFDNIFGNGKNQIPLGSRVTNAKLTFQVISSTNWGGLVSFYRMRQNWNEETATYNSFQPLGGVQSDGVEAEIEPDGILGDPRTGVKSIEVTKSLQAWASGIPNFGWLVDQFGTNGWDFVTSEGPTISQRPILEVTFDEPVGPGQFNFPDAATSVVEGDAGESISTFFVTRTGGLEGTVSVEYKVTGVTATKGADFADVGLAGKLTFGPGEIIKPFQLTFLGDTLIEGPETLTVELFNPVGGSLGTVSKTTITIGDQDVLLNEVVANVSGADDGYEHFELIGTPNATLNNIYLVVFDGRTDTDKTNSVGVAQMVVNLSGTKIGSNGLMVVRPTNFKYTVTPGTSEVIATQLDKLGGGISDLSITTALIMSPVPIVQGQDYDTTAFSETGNVNTAVIPIGVGILDGLPAGAALLDSVGWCEGGGGDSDRVLTLAHPGARVTQPQGFEGNIASDAASRYKGDRRPNNAGSWYNGEIEFPNAPLYSLPPRATVTLPAGAQVTPGAPNLPRAIQFALTSVKVGEEAGSVTLTVDRLGDDSIETSVEFKSVSGTAKAGLDFTAVSGKLTFGVGVTALPIVVPIRTDNEPEGFESFTVELSNPGDPFRLGQNSVATVTIVDDDAQVMTYQNDPFGVGYQGTFDAGLVGWLVNEPLGSDPSISIDQSDDDPTIPNDPVRPTQGLIRFDDLAGTGANQIPVGSKIYSAFITFFVNDTSTSAAKVRMFRMNEAWNESFATWANPTGAMIPTITNGVTPDGVEARTTPDAVVPDPAIGGFVDVPLSIDGVQQWVNGTAPNYGWAMIQTTDNGWDFDSSESVTQIDGQFGATRPKLTLIYTPPSGAGIFTIAEPTYSVGEAAGTAKVTVLRTGGSDGTVTLNWAITGGTATAADYSGPASGTITFLPGVLAQTISIPIVNDAELEPNETIVLSLTGSAKIDRATTTIVIRDNDFDPANPAILLNEVLTNPPGNDQPWEYIEFFGTANAGLGSLYFIALESDPNPFAGNADFVADLTGFRNGANGFTAVTATDPGHSFPSATTRIPNRLLDADNSQAFLNLQNDGTSLVLVYSPDADFGPVFDFDWDNDGKLDFPAGAVIVDGISWKIGGGKGVLYTPVDLSQTYTPDAASRIVGDLTPLSASAWFLGQIDGGPDSLRYDPIDNFNLPVAGAALTPGSVNVSATTPLTKLTNVKIDDGTGQASAVRSITLTFSNPVTTSAAAFKLTNQSGAAISGLNLLASGTGTKTVTLTFGGSPVVGGSLPDGKYRLRIDGDGLFADGRVVDAADNGTPGSSRLVDFQRQFGDNNGDGKVDFTDFLALRSTFGLKLGDTGFNAAFDFDNDNDVDFADFLQFRTRFGSGL